MQILQLLNENIFYQFLSAVFSIILTVTIIYVKKEIERNYRRNYYNGIATKENLGDINIKIDEELPSENFFKLITMWGIQPLLLLVLISFIDNNNTYTKICLFFIIIIFTILHEFLTGLKYSDKRSYQVLLLAIWLVSYSTLSYEKNKSVIIKIDLKTTSYNQPIHKQATAYNSMLSSKSVNSSSLTGNPYSKCHTSKEVLHLNAALY